MGTTKVGFSLQPSKFEELRGLRASTSWIAPKVEPGHCTRFSTIRDAQYTIAPFETAFWTAPVDNSQQTLESTDDGFRELAWSSVARFADRTKKKRTNLTGNHRELDQHF